MNILNWHVSKRKDRETQDIGISYHILMMELPPGLSSRLRQKRLFTIKVIDPNANASASQLFKLSAWSGPVGKHGVFMTNEITGDIDGTQLTVWDARKQAVDWLTALLIQFGKSGFALDENKELKQAGCLDPQLKKNLSQLYMPENDICSGLPSPHPEQLNENTNSLNTNKEMSKEKRPPPEN